MKELTKAEEQVMQYLWELDGGFVKELIELYPEPRPAYNTVSTIVRILETKGFVDHETHGKSYRYYPLISKEEYRKFSANQVVTGYFDGSASKLLSFFLKEKKMGTKELDEMMQLIEKAKRKNS